MEADPHLQPETARRLLAGAIRGEEARRLARHLEAGCDTCEALLAREEGPLEGAADLALHRLGPPGQPGNDLEWARIRRELAGPARLRWLAGAAAAAVLLVAGGGLLLRAGPPPAGAPPGWDGLKGEAGAAAVRLRFSVASPGPGGPGSPTLERGASGATLSEDAQLLFRAEVSGPAELALLRLGPDGAEVVWQGRARAAGAVDVELGGRPAAVPLRGLAGRQRFALVGAPSLGAERLAAVARALSAGGAAPPGEPVALDLVEVVVR